jgi:hypothetical protein
MQPRRHSDVGIGFQVYTHEGGEPFGAVRMLERDHLVVYVENAGDFTIKADALRSVHDGKVVVDEKHLDPALRAAIAHAHDKEEKGV